MVIKSYDIKSTKEKNKIIYINLHNLHKRCFDTLETASDQKLFQIFTSNLLNMIVSFPNISNTIHCNMIETDDC